MKRNFTLIELLVVIAIIAIFYAGDYDGFFISNPLSWNYSNSAFGVILGCYEDVADDIKGGIKTASQCPSQVDSEDGKKWNTSYRTSAYEGMYYNWDGWIKYNDPWCSVKLEKLHEVKTIVTDDPCLSCHDGKTAVNRLNYDGSAGKFKQVKQSLSAFASDRGFWNQYKLWNELWWDFRQF